MKKVITGCVFGFILGLVSTATVVGSDNPMGAAELFLAHLLAEHLAVPEPVRLQVQPGPVGFEGYTMRHEALIERNGPGWWLIRYDQQAFVSATRRRVEFVLAHELCHAIYDWNITIGQLSDKELRSRQTRADNCARQALRAHKKCPKR